MFQQQIDKIQLDAMTDYVQFIRRQSVCALVYRHLDELKCIAWIN